MAFVQPTLAELVSHLKKTALPTVAVEGTTDLMLIRRIQKHIGADQMSLLPCGSRSVLLEVFRQKATFSDKKTAFFADRDLWYFDGVPAEYADIVFTYGYSIENDMYHDGKQRLNRLLYPAELPFLNSLMANVVRWFAFEWELFKSGGVPEFAKHKILNPAVIAMESVDFESSFLLRRGFAEPTPSTIEAIEAGAHAGLQGKLIFDCYFKVFKDLRDENDASYSHDHLHDFCIIEGVDPSNPTSRINQIIATLQAKLQ
jgi:hypothetical protein